jgi:hypothetical protein
MQVEVLGQVGKVAGVVVHVVALADLRGAAAPAPVMGDHPVPVVQEKSIWASQSSDDRGHPLSRVSRANRPSQ